MLSWLVVLLGVAGRGGAEHWCGYRAEWNTSQAQVLWEGGAGGGWVAARPGPVLVTLTATVGGMLPPKPGDLLLVPSPVRCNTILEQKPQSQTCLVINVSC